MCYYIYIYIYIGELVAQITVACLEGAYTSVHSNDPTGNNPNSPNNPDNPQNLNIEADMLM